MWILATLLLATSLSTPPQAPPPSQESEVAGGEQSNESGAARGDQQLEAYQDLLRRYNNAVGSHRFDCRQLRQQGVPEADWPPSPLFDYFERFVELAESGNGWAQSWAASNSEHAIEDPLERRVLLERMFGLLVKEHASESIMLDAIDHLARARRLLGDEFVLAKLEEISEVSQVAEIEAKALLASASVLWKNGKTENEDDIVAAVELWQILVDGYAGTEPAKQAAQFLFTRTNRAMQNAQRSWLRTVRGLREQGIGEEGWPSYPVEAYRGQYEALARTGHQLSMYRVEVFYPAYEQALRGGIVDALRFITEDTTARYLPLEWPWMDVKFDILQLLFEAYPDDAWVFDEVQALAGQAGRFDQTRYQPLLETLVEGTQTDRIEYEAKLVMAKNLEAGRSFGELEGALALYSEVIERSPIERQRKEAELARRQFAWAMPGAEMTNFSAKDGEGLELESSSYRGKVLLMYFWGFWSPECVADFPWINEIHQRYQGQPLAVLGFNTDTISYKSYASRSAKAGIGWRSVLETKRRGPRVKLFAVKHFPTVIVVDAQGVIRGRNLGHAETEALIERLLAEMSGQPEDSVGTEAPASVVDAGLRGRVVFDGPREPLPALTFSAEQTKGCCAAGHEVDPTNRKRLVDPDGGLANVVVYVEVKGQVVNGKGVEVVLDQVECRFEPHVAVVPVGGTLVVKNSDGVSHNVNMNSRYNGRINEMMPASTKRTVEFDREDKATIGCDVHPWMSSHVFVVETPYWALTGEDGSFSIPGLPPGEHIARYWHEELGELKSERFTVEAGKASVLELVMKEKSQRGGRRRPPR